MQTITQTVAGAQTIQFNITGKYFTILATNLGLNVRFFNGGKLKELGTIAALLAGLEVTFNLDGDNFDRVEIDTLGADTFTIGIGNGQARYNRSQGNVAVTNTPAVTISGNSRSAPLFVEDGISSYGATYRSITTLAANTPDTIFTPAANTNGAILHSAQFVVTNGTTSTNCPAYLAKTSSPVSVIDGDAILSSDNVTILTGSFSHSGCLKKPIKIPPGKGLYFIDGTAESVASRSALYTLL